MMAAAVAPAPDVEALGRHVGEGGRVVIRAHHKETLAEAGVALPVAGSAFRSNPDMNAAIY